MGFLLIPAFMSRAETGWNPAARLKRGRESRFRKPDGIKMDRPALEVTYFTDPLCSWSWAFEPHWRRLRERYGARIRYRYVMSGMIPDIRTYQDPWNSVRMPSQIGPLWREVRELTGVPIQDRIWAEDPPSSSHPACLAVKAAELQGRMLGEAYLEAVRKAVMLDGRNIAKGDVLLDVARALASPGSTASGLDLDRFTDDLIGQDARNAFRDDLEEVRTRHIQRFPTFILTPREGRSALLVGFRPFEVFLEAIRHLAPELETGYAAEEPEVRTRSGGEPIDLQG